MAKGHHKPGKLELAERGIYPDRFVEVSRNYLYPTNPNRLGPSAPAIYMSGHWLHQAGFRIYDLVRVRVIHGCIALTVKVK